jgi:hypothetical protein
MANLHRDPAVLRSAAAAVDALVPALQVPGLDPVDLDALAAAPGGGSLVAEHDRLTASLVRAGRELADLVVGLCAVAAAVESVEHDAVRAMAGVGR